MKPAMTNGTTSGVCDAEAAVTAVGGLRRAVMVLLALILCTSTILGATGREDPPAGESSTAESADPETGGAEEKTETKKGPKVLPIPIFITEPAIGYGLGAAVAYFHTQEDEVESTSSSIAPAFTTTTAAKAGERQKVPPTVSGIAAAYTDKGTWGVGLAHSASWSKDRTRYTGALGYVHVVSTVYFDDQPFDFTLETGLLYQDVKFRIGGSDFFVGARLAYLAPELVFDLDPDDVPVEAIEGKLKDFGLALQSDYDGRDNKMTPNRGQFIELVAWKHFEVLGGETDYWKVGVRAQSFHEMAHDKLVLGIQLDLDAAGGDPPLWGYPWITMRGIPALRYQNESTAVLETELRWNLLERWAAVGFVGIAGTRGDVPHYEDESGIVAGGIGGRFLFRPQDSLWVGIDLAKGPEEYVLYVQVGHAW